MRTRSAWIGLVMLEPGLAATLGSGLCDRNLSIPGCFAVGYGWPLVWQGRAWLVYSIEPTVSWISPEALLWAQHSGLWHSRSVFSFVLSSPSHGRPKLEHLTDASRTCCDGTHPRDSIARATRTRPSDHAYQLARRPRKHHMALAKRASAACGQNESAQKPFRIHAEISLDRTERAS